MSVVELRADDGAARPVTGGDAVRAVEPQDRVRPNMTGDLSSLFRAAPMFRRAVAGYDRFQVDSYVQWAEDEIATADREREHLVIRQLSTQAALDEARQLLSHSASGGEFLQVSRRIGALLASAADEAENMRAEAEADRSAGAAEAARMVAQATEVLAAAEARAESVILETAAEVEAMTTAAGRVLDEAERTAIEARAEADARLDELRDMEQLANETAGRIRQQATEDASAALSTARAEVIRMLSTGREERRRADAAAAAARELLEREAVARCAALSAEIAALEQRRSALSALSELEAATEPLARTARRPLDTHLRELREKLRWRSGSLRHP